MTKKIFIGNWKMAPDTLLRAKDIYSKYTKFSKKLKKTEAVVCVPYVYTHSLRALKGAPRLSVGAQDVFGEVSGSYTGEVNIKMLKDAGVTHVILGHSERRTLGETSEEINKKIQVVLGAGLSAVVCIGEKNRDVGGKFYNELQQELENTLSDIQPKYFRKLIIAYEPIWAIGKPSDEAMDGERMYEMNIFIQKAVTDLFGKDAVKKLRIIYGGSIDSTNIERMISEGQVDGVLVGRAGLNQKEFGKMLEILDDLS